MATIESLSWATAAANMLIPVMVPSGATYKTNLTSVMTQCTTVDSWFTYHTATGAEVTSSTFSDGVKTRLHFTVNGLQSLIDLYAVSFVDSDGTRQNRAVGMLTYADYQKFAAYEARIAALETALNSGISLTEARAQQIETSTTPQINNLTGPETQQSDGNN